MSHLGQHRRFPSKMIGWKNWIEKSVEAARTSNESNQNPKIQLSRTERPVGEQRFTQEEEVDIIFRVSGLPHAVVKHAENFRVRELVKKIESHPHREALQADLQQNNVYIPFSNNSKEMIRELGNVELFELWDTIPKVQCSHCFLYWNQGVIYCTCGQCLVESESRRKLNQDWMLSLTRTTWSWKDLLMVLDMARPKYKESTKWLGIRGRDAAGKPTLKVNILQVFTIDVSETKSIVNHNSQLAGQKRAKRWTNWQIKITRTISLQRYSKDTKDNGISLWISQAKTRLCDFDQIFELQSLSQKPS